MEIANLEPAHAAYLTMVVVAFLGFMLVLASIAIYTRMGDKTSRHRQE